jgi:SAM-dependent methyltransferase
MHPDIGLMCCPVTRSPLTWNGDGRLVSAEGCEYQVAHGVPILLDAGNDLFDADSVFAAESGANARSRRARLRNLAKRCVPSPTRSVRSRQRFDALADLVSEHGPDARVLIIGGGIVGNGMENFVERPGFQVVETDVYIGPRTQIVCDAHRLPFIDDCFDAVVVQAVLEHVLDPHGVVAEIHRVLKPDGLVYAETPFMQQVHEGAYDFTRFTMVGHRRLFRRFDELDAGVVCGPSTALIWAMRYFARSLPRRSRTARAALDAFVCLAFFWLKYLDDLLVGHSGSSDAASGVYFLGRARAVPISDREVVESYTGAFTPRPSR